MLKVLKWIYNLGYKRGIEVGRRREQERQEADRMTELMISNLKD